MAVLLGLAATSPAMADTTYTAAPGNFTQTVQDNTNPPYAGSYNAGADGSGAVQLGLYANGGSGGVGSNPQSVAYRTFTTDGTDTSSTAIALQVGQSFSVTLKLNGSQGINGNSIGFALNNGTAASTTTNYNTGGRFEYSFSAGDSNAAVYDANGKSTTGLPTYAQFSGGLTYTFTLVSTNEYNLSVSGGGATYNIGTLGGTANATIDSFSLFNRGYNNSDAIYGGITVTNNAAIGLTANTGETKTVAGQIINNAATTTNSVQKLGAGVVALTANNTYSGNTSVSAGTLLVNNATGSGTGTGAVTVNSGGTLGGTGTITGTVGVSGTINPGNVGTAGTAAAVGTLTTGALTLNSASASAFDLATTTSYDKLVSTGTVTLAGTATINLGTDVAAGTVVDLVHGTSLNGSYANFVNNTNYTIGDEVFTAVYTSTDFELVAVPEPATCLAGLLMVGLAGYSQRRRFHHAHAA